MAGKSIAGLSIVINGNSAGFERAVDRAVATAAGLAARIGGLGASAGGAMAKLGGGGGALGMTAAVTAGNLLSQGIEGIASAAAGAASGALKLAADWQQAGVQFEVMTGSAGRAGKLLKDIEGLAIKTPYSSDELARASKMLMSFGVTADNIVPTLSRLGDVAMGSAENLGEIARQFGQVMASGQLQKDEWKIMVERGADATAFARAFGGSMQDLLKGFEVGAVGADVMVRAFNHMTDAGGRFHGMNARSSQTTKGQWASLSETAEKLQKNVGTAFIEGFRPGELLGMASDRIDGLAGQADKLVGVFQKFRGVVDQVGPSVVAAFTAGAGAIGDMAGAVFNVRMDDLKGSADQFMKGAVVGFAELTAGAAKLGANVAILAARFDALMENGLVRRFSDAMSGKFDLSNAGLPTMLGRALGMSKDDMTIQLGPRVTGEPSKAEGNLKKLMEARDRMLSPEEAGRRAGERFDRSIGPERAAWQNAARAVQQTANVMNVAQITNDSPNQGASSAAALNRNTNALDRNTRATEKAGASEGVGF